MILRFDVEPMEEKRSEKKKKKAFATDEKLSFRVKWNVKGCKFPFIVHLL